VPGSYQRPEEAGIVEGGLMYYENERDFNVLVGKTLESVVNSDKLYHSDDCCESVTVEDIAGNLDDLVGSPILQAEESSNSDDPHGQDYEPESYTWTFYRIATAKGLVVIRWYGTSNGYYSESVSFAKVG
jgi:hypothetical protein